MAKTKKTHGRNLSNYRSIRLDPDTDKKLEQIAKSEDRSLVDTVRVLLKEAVATRQSK